MVQDEKLLLNTSEGEASMMFLLLWLDLNSSAQVYLVLGSPVSSVSLKRLYGSGGRSENSQLPWSLFSTVFLEAAAFTSFYYFFFFTIYFYLFVYI